MTTTLTTVAEPPVIMRDDPGLADVVDLFAGPGGWDLAARDLGLHVTGFELDVTACETRHLAGLATVRCDVACLPADLHRPVRGVIASSPCTTFANSGKRAALVIRTELEHMVRDELTGQGDTTRGKRVSTMTATLASAGHTDPAETVASAMLITEAARFIRVNHPEWVTLEQVPAALPVFKVYATELCKMGYSVWWGILNAADYGLGQIRRRAVLIASRTRQVGRPLATHYNPAAGSQIFGQRWLSMESVLGWGMLDYPSPTVTAGGIKSGGAEVYGNGARKKLTAQMTAGRWAPKPGKPLSMRPSPRDCARLQGFPKDHQFAGLDGRQHQQIGNAVPPPFGLVILAEATGRPRPPAVMS